MNKYVLKGFAFFLITFLCVFSSCVEKKPRLTRAHYKIVDSLVNAQKVGIRKDLDSLCDIRFAAEIDAFTDSIVQDRMNEIRRKIEADAKNN